MSETKIVEKTIIYHVDFAKHRADRVFGTLNRPYGTRCNNMETSLYQLNRAEVLNTIPPAPKQNIPELNNLSLEYKIENLKDRYGNDGRRVTVGQHYYTSNRKNNEVYLDTYGDGDVHNSIYSERTPIWNDPMPFPLEPGLLDRACTYDGHVNLGHKSDALMWLELKYGWTRYFLEHTKCKQLTIRTRSDLIAHDDYIKLLTKLRDSGVQITIKIMVPSHGDDELARIEEPGAPSIKRRLEALNKLNENKITTKLIKQRKQYNKAS